MDSNVLAALPANTSLSQVVQFAWLARRARRQHKQQVLSSLSACVLLVTREPLDLAQHALQENIKLKAVRRHVLTAQPASTLQLLPRHPTCVCNALRASTRPLKELLMKVRACSATQAHTTSSKAVAQKQRAFCVLLGHIHLHLVFRGQTRAWRAPQAKGQKKAAMRRRIVQRPAPPARQDQMGTVFPVLQGRSKILQAPPLARVAWKTPTLLKGAPHVRAMQASRKAKQKACALLVPQVRTRQSLATRRAQIARLANIVTRYQPRCVLNVPWEPFRHKLQSLMMCVSHAPRIPIR
mmetsp:Transcript_18766/g.29905  ORF Transcript_18766/g.29905 Transcript_18766/m.29905 type:complete len:296 (-) Transcript_18766:2553-3440(-)